MTKPKPKPKRKNPADLTLRNLRAMKKRIENLEKSYRDLERRIQQLGTVSISRKALEASMLSPEEFIKMRKG